VSATDLHRTIEAVWRIESARVIAGLTRLTRDVDLAEDLAQEALLTVTRKSGEELSYDPRRLRGVTVYRETERTFAEGDRVQMTAPYHAEKLANRELGTVDKIDGGGNLKLKMDSGRAVEFNVRQHPHLDYGYAVTSHSSQGQTADRVLIHVDSEQAHSQLLNSRFAYVSVSRAQIRCSDVHQ
jgi:ATP-dependent exoDNAse (exonuclease V) alpha subunit